MANGNGNDTVKAAGLVKHFRFFPWQTQVALVVAATSALGGGSLGAMKFFQPDPVVAEILDVVKEHRVESRGINSALVLKLDTLNTNTAKLLNAAMHNICHEPTNREWIERLRPRADRYCRQVLDLIEGDFVKGAY